MKFFTPIVISPRMKGFFLLLVFIVAGNTIFPQAAMPDRYNVRWTTQSANSSESMPCGGGDIGLNVWVENGEILFYLSPFQHSGIRSLEFT